jgi:hypothetical protein
VGIKAGLNVFYTVLCSASRKLVTGPTPLNEDSTAHLKAFIISEKELILIQKVQTGLENENKKEERRIMITALPLTLGQ